MYLFWTIVICIFAKSCFTLDMCPSRCTCLDIELLVYCNQSALDLVPITLNPETEKLFLNHNRIKLISASFIFYFRLQVLDLSSNLISSIGPSEFSSQKELTNFQLSSNRLSSLSNHSLLGLYSLRILNLSDNLLVSLSDKSFIECVHLEDLDLSRNRIKMIEADAFMGLKRLQHLNLQENRLSKLFPASFHHLPNLLTLDLSSNFLTRIADYAFTSLIKLNELRLSFCQLNYISSKSLSKENNLQNLMIQGNHLADVPTHLIVNLSKLIQLHIGGSKLTRIGADAFKGSPNLQKLFIKSSYRLSYIHADALSDLNDLKQLVIEHCPSLNFISSNLLRRQKRLSYLSLANNGLSTFPAHLINWDQLERFDIHNNPIVCNCSLLWLWKFLNKSQKSKESVQEVLCSSPAQFKHRSLHTLTYQDLKCANNFSVAIIFLSVSALLLITGFVLFVGNIWRKSRVPFIVFQTKHYRHDLNDDDLIYEKGRILDNQVPYSPSPYYSSTNYSSSPLHSHFRSPKMYKPSLENRPTLGQCTQAFTSNLNKQPGVGNLSPVPHQIKEYSHELNSNVIIQHPILEYSETHDQQTYHPSPAYECPKPTFGSSSSYTPSASLVVIPSFIKKGSVAKI